MTRIPRAQTWNSLRRQTPRSSGPTRRQFLATATATVATVLSGCLGDDETDGPDATNRTDDGDDTGETQNGNGTENDGDSESRSTVPESFDDPDELREYSREYVELVATGETDAAAEWFAPELDQQFTAGNLDTLWQSFVGTQEAPESYRSVIYFGTERGNDIFIVWAEVDGDAYQFTITYTANGVVNFQITPIQEWTRPGYVTENEIVEEEIALETPLECELEGEIALPAGNDTVPGVVLVHGNGPQDRDATVGPNRPFKELAWGLASRGIAVLRYDKRTFACDVDIANATIDDIVTDDALTAISRLREHDRVTSEEVFVAGFSFGGLLTPRIADRDGDVAGTIMLAPGPTRSFGTTIVEQTKHLLDLQPLLGDDERETILAEVETEAEKIRTLDIGDDEVVRYGGREYYRSLQEYDHEKTAAQLDVPQFLLQGGNDWQVTVEDDLPSWRDALGDRDDVTITVYDELNHLFQESEPPLTQREYARPNSPVAKRVIGDIASFIAETADANGQSVERPKIRV